MLLYSDFTDYYDHMFAGKQPTIDGYNSDTVLIRGMASGPSRLDALALLQGSGIPTVEFALLNSTQEWQDDWEVVLHFVLHGHAGKGKVYCESLREARIIGGDYNVVTRFMGLRQGHSVRALSVGGVYDYTYYFSEDWRSNVDPVSIRRIENNDPILRDFPFNGEFDEMYPLYAIDYIYTADGWVACDLNTSPGLRGTPTQDALDASEVVNLIECAVGSKTAPQIVKRPDVQSHGAAVKADAENRLWVMEKLWPDSVRAYVKSAYAHEGVKMVKPLHVPDPIPKTPIVRKDALPRPRGPFDPQGKDHNKSLFALIEEYVEPNFRDQASMHYGRVHSNDDVYEWTPWKPVFDGFSPVNLISKDVVEIQTEVTYDGGVRYREKRRVSPNSYEPLPTYEYNGVKFVTKKDMEDYRLRMIRRDT